MGKQIIKQPNGKYCIFSSIVDNVTHYDMTIEGIVNLYLEEVKSEILEKLQRVISKLEDGEKPYNQFTYSYDEMLALIKDVHGKKESVKVKYLIEHG